MKKISNDQIVRLYLVTIFLASLFFGHFFLFSSICNAKTYYSSYGQSSENDITITNVGNYSFQVDKIAANMNTEWYVNKVYTGEKKNGWSSWWANDPEYTKYISGDVQIKAIVYDRYWHHYKEYHIWNVKLSIVKVNTTLLLSHSPSSPVIGKDTTITFKPNLDGGGLKPLSDLTIYVTFNRQTKTCTTDYWGRASVVTFNVPNSAGSYSVSAKFDGTSLFNSSARNDSVTVSSSGSVSVRIEPPGAVSSGARWKLTSGPDQNWKESNHSVRVPVGNYTITFNKPSGWGSPSEMVPADINISVGDGANVLRTGAYKRIVSAYWWGPLDANEGTVATMCAEVEGFPVGTPFTFKIFENVGLWSKKLVPSSMTGSVYESGGKYYVKAKWNTARQSGQAGYPKLVFDVSNGNIRKTSRNKITVHPVSQIVDFKVPTGQYAPGTMQKITVTIKNTGTNARSFWVGLSFAGPQTDIAHWPKGWLDVPPQRVPEAGKPDLAPDKTATVTFRFHTNALLPEGQYTAYAAVWSGFNPHARQFPENPKPGEKTYSVNGLMVSPRFASEHKQTFYLNSDSLKDPYATTLGSDDPGGLYKDIPIQQRAANLYDLPRNLNSHLHDINGKILSSTSQNIVVLIHGWNVHPPAMNAYAEKPWKTLLDNLKAKDPTTWQIVPYHWEHDANTGFIAPKRDATKLQSTTKNLLIDGVGAMAYISIEAVEQLVIANATVCAYRSYMQGLALGRILCKDVGASNLKRIQLISHSAGAWAVYATLRYLHEHAKNAEIQVTYLDPFIPGNIIGPINNLNFVDGIYPGRKFNEDILKSTVKYATIKTRGALKADCYWSLKDETYWGGVVATAMQDWLGEWLGPGINTIIDSMSGKLYDATVVHWTWADSYNALVFKVDDTGDKSYISHSGPIKFYADSVMNSNGSFFSGKAWGESLAANNLPGTITVSIKPNNRSWTISGPLGFAGNGRMYTGDHTFTKASIGSYTWTGQHINGYDTPVPETKMLTNGGTVLFKSFEASKDLGDVNGDGIVNLADAILVMRVTAGFNDVTVNLNADVNGDGKIGAEEVIYILKNIVGRKMK